MKRAKNLITANTCLVLACLGFSPMLCAEGQAEPLDLSVEDLLNVKVTSVAKKAQSLNDAPAAAFVINNEDIKRSGATNIPDALRLAPGLDVARIDANKWAVTARGFNGRRANKLLVLIDGRSAYTRSFAGVYWENQDVMMEDIDRIEIIRGPGATLWGANAVNGVINIITKDSAKTQGALLNAGGGTHEQGFGSFRYGAKFGEDTTARAYIKGFNRGEFSNQAGGGAGDDWSKVQGGFRLDSRLSPQDKVTFQGDIYETDTQQLSQYPSTLPPFTVNQKDNIPATGGNLLARLQHTFSSTSDYSLQFYYDNYKRTEAPFIESRDTLDVEFQHRFAMTDRQEIIWGANYRYGNDLLEGKAIADGTMPYRLNPVSVSDQVFSGFIQDEITLITNRLWLTVGSKFEHNDYSGFEGQPSARILWAPHNQHRFWAGVSRAVRTPARAEQDLSALLRTDLVSLPIAPVPIPLAIKNNGSSSFRSEEVISYEAGYRTAFSKSASLDVTGFYNDYRDLRYVLPGTPGFSGNPPELNLIFGNHLQGKSYGIETAVVWQMLEWWRWDVNYSWLHTDLNNPDRPQTGVSPEQRMSLRGSISLRQALDLDFWFRYVDSNFAVGEKKATTISAYTTLDLRLAWRPCKQLELSLVGQNLLQDSHLEYVNENQTLPTTIDRSLYGKASWSF